MQYFTLKKRPVSTALSAQGSIAFCLKTKAWPLDYFLQEPERALFLSSPATYLLETALYA